jgi:hypothetical protein
MGVRFRSVEALRRSTAVECEALTRPYAAGASTFRAAAPTTECAEGLAVQPFHQSLGEEPRARPQAEWRQCSRSRRTTAGSPTSKSHLGADGPRPGGVLGLVDAWRRVPEVRIQSQYICGLLEVFEMRPFARVLGVIGQAGLQDSRRRKAGGAMPQAAAEEDTVGASPTEWRRPCPAQPAQQRLAASGREAGRSRRAHAADHARASDAPTARTPTVRPGS